MKTFSLSAVILTKNEENTIELCINSLGFCDQIVVVDDYSIDKTALLAKNLGANVVKHHLHDDFSIQRNFGLALAKGEWVLFVDADEIVSQELANEIKNKINNKNHDTIVGYYLPRKDYLWGRWIMHGDVPPGMKNGLIELLRLAKKNAGKWSGAVHETWEVDGNTGSLRHPLLHYPHQTTQQFLESINYYSTIYARQLFQNGKKASVLAIIFYPVGKFVHNYILNLGFLDGMPGFLQAVLMSFHSFLVRGKLYLLTHNKQGQ